MKHILYLITGAALYAQTPALLIQSPTVNKTHIVFSYAGDLWKVARTGGDATHLTTGAGLETHPIFSPDGTQIAFEGEYDGNRDVYVMPADGGIPKRLTFHPGEDTPVGWSPDGKSILFRTSRDAYSRFPRLYTVSTDGAFPTPVDLPAGDSGSFSPDGTHIAYLPV